MKIRLFALIGLTLFLLTGLLACSSASNTSASSSAAIGETFTLEQLATYDGQNGNASYIAVDGIVYDVSDVSPWKGGIHFKTFKAGLDYTEQIESAPHGKNVLRQAVQVGVLRS
jgi:predicted heme/steroid binding protein